MSGELQTIPARHGVATFVPRGRTIKVINTYGKQVVSMWAFTLGAPPEEGGEDGPDDQEIEEEAKKLQEAAEKEEKGEKQEPDEPAKDESNEQKAEDDNEDETEKSNLEEGQKEESTEETGDPPEQAPDTPDNEKITESTEKSTESTEKSTESTAESAETTAKQPSKRTWASYLPSIPYRSKGKGDEADKAEPGAEQEPSPEEQKAQNEANTKKWSSYIPTGKGFSSYIPNVEVPSKEGVVSAFKASHNRDPNKSYAEQLYDFSKTPVGAGTIAAATGSGYASSVYAAYSAYAQTHPSKDDRPPMEYLSLPHTRASSYKLVPEVDDTLLTNLRNPIITLVEDTTPGAHDTLTAACDANLYASLGVNKPAEHGSCAENLVLALKEMNENAGLKGTKAVGADISVNIAPTPLHLFMVAPIELPSDAKTAEAGAKGAKLAVAEPKGKKRSFVRFRAERDVVIVFSACPNDVGPQNGGRCMAANFMVEEAEADDNASLKSGKKTPPKKLNAAGQKDESREPTEKGSGDSNKLEAKVKPKKLHAPNEKGEDKRAERKKAETEVSEEREVSEEPEEPEARSENKLPEDEPSKDETENEQPKTSPKQQTPKKQPSTPPSTARTESTSDKASETFTPPDASPKPKKKPKKLEVRSK